MRGKGITYDTGFLSSGTSTHEPFDPEVVRREMSIIREDLHCNAVRITGGYADRLKSARRRKRFSTSTLPRHAVGAKDRIHYSGGVLRALMLTQLCLPRV